MTVATVDNPFLTTSRSGTDDVALAASGDRVAFEIVGQKVTLRRVDPLDRAFMKLSEHAFTEWNSPEDEEAFRDL